MERGAERGSQAEAFLAPLKYSCFAIANADSHSCSHDQLTVRSKSLLEKLLSATSLGSLEHPGAEARFRTQCQRAVWRQLKGDGLEVRLPRFDEQSCSPSRASIR